MELARDWPGATEGSSDSSRPFLLAQLCPVSPQRHHFAQAIAILNTHGCNIFDHFSRKVMGCVGICLVGAGHWLDRRSRSALEWMGCVQQGP